MFEAVGAVTGVIGALAGLGSFWVTEKQRRKINKKIAMLNNAETAFEVLPAWYTRRMMQDEWYFGLQTSDGHVIAISRIKGISDDAQWMDVELLLEGDFPKIEGRSFVTAVANDRRNASIRISNIVAAYDIVTS